VKPFYLSSETFLPIKPFYLSNSTCTATLGFDDKKAKDAVLETGGDVKDAVNWLVANCA
jgi:hypothetical protein